MNNKFINLLLIILLTLSLNSCYENTVIETNKPILTSLSKNTVFIGDELTIYGQNLGVFPLNAKILIDSFKIADKQSRSIIDWNNSFIKIKIDTNFTSGKLFVIIDKDTSNSFQISYSSVPDIAFVIVEPISSFKMGSSMGSYDESPEHNVRLTKRLEVSKYEVTQNLWKLVMNSNPSELKGDSLPVVNISWENALDFCNKLSKMKNYPECYKLDTASKSWNWVADSGGYRLPTEAEWEYFARANSTEEISGTGNINDMAWYELNSGYNIHPVGQKVKNSFGLYDVHGNAREWCWDLYSDTYYMNSDLTDPIGPTNSNFTNHVARGGSSIDAAKYIRIANRVYRDTLYTITGIRIVRTIK